jgi:hypothetical protein
MNASSTTSSPRYYVISSEMARALRLAAKRFDGKGFYTGLGAVPMFIHGNVTASMSQRHGSYELCANRNGELMSPEELAMYILTEDGKRSKEIA